MENKKLIIRFRRDQERKSNFYEVGWGNFNEFKAILFEGARPRGIDEIEFEEIN